MAFACEINANIRNFTGFGEVRAGEVILKKDNVIQLLACRCQRNAVVAMGTPRAVERGSYTIQLGEQIVGSLVVRVLLVGEKIVWR